MSVPLRGALIGCGYASWFQLTAWSQIKDVEIVAVSSRSLENAQARAQEFNIGQVYTDYHAMLAQEQLDFVDIATPPDVHLEMIREGVGHGLHVLCQKPIAATLRELRTMIQVCDAADVVFMVNENGRFQPWFRKIRALLDQDAIGQPYYTNLTARYRMTLPEMDAGRRTGYFSHMPRLIVYELGTHYLDTLRYLFGEPQVLYARTLKISAAIAGEDLAAIMLSFDSSLAVIDMSWASMPTWGTHDTTSWGEYRIEGREGTIHLDVNGQMRVITGEAEQQHTFPANSEVLGYRAAQQHFVDCIRSGEEPETSGKQTLKTMELVLGAYYSAEAACEYRIGTNIDTLL